MVGNTTEYNENLKDKQLVAKTTDSSWVPEGRPSYKSPALILLLSNQYKYKRKNLLCIQMLKKTSYPEV